MATVDFGTVRAFVVETRVDVFFPRGYDRLMKALKDMKGRWSPDRKCWSVEERFSRLSTEEIVARVRDVLAEDAPNGWDQVLKRFGSFACTSKKYDVKVAEGGIRITLPPGHPHLWALKEIQGASSDDREKLTWLLPASVISPKIIRPILQRAAEEDRELFMSYIEHLEGRTIKGLIPITPEQADEMNLVVGAFVYADHAFLKIADPIAKESPIHTWPFKVLERADEEDGVKVRLSYLEPNLAFRSVRWRQGQPEESRVPALDLPHATEKWEYKRL